MQGLLQPTHGLFILFVVLVIFGPGGPSALGQGLRQGVESMTPTLGRLLKFLIAILLGNGLYFALSPYLPPPAQHHATLDLGTLVDLWFCLFVYGIMELGHFLAEHRKNK